MLSNPVIVIPGVTASYLQDQYPISPENIWTVLSKDYERSSLHPDDRRYEALEPARVVAGQMFEICYKELVEELRYNLRPAEDLPVPVYPFPYDWRQPLSATEASLRAFVDEVIHRTALLRHYRGSHWHSNPKVNLVGHSMGGLIIAGYLQKYGARSAVGKVASVGTPFDGSYEAVIKIATGTANLGTAAPSSREREAARLTPSLYHLLPGNIDGLELPPELAEKSLFDIELWQPSILQTIAEYIRLRGLNPENREQQARASLEEMLSEGGRHRQRVRRLKLTTAGLTNRDWLCIAGVNAMTRVRLAIELDPGGLPSFRFSSDDRKNEWENASFLTGDGTVPLRGAVPTFLDPANVVCVRPQDFGYWEIGDKAGMMVGGFHGFLPTMDLVHRLIVRHFKEEQSDVRQNTWGCPLPGIANWAPPIQLKPKP